MATIKRAAAIHEIEDDTELETYNHNQDDEYQSEEEQTFADILEANNNKVRDRKTGRFTPQKKKTPYNSKRQANQMQG